jgi:hypothetical protein
MEKEFIPYEQALALKKLGFDEPCLAQYRKYDVGEATLDIGFSKNEIISKFDNLVLFCSTPLYQQAFRWFREKYDLRKQYGIFPHHTIIFNYLFDGGNEEEAELECLRKLIEIVKRK